MDLGSVQFSQKEMPTQRLHCWVLSTSLTRLQTLCHFSCSCIKSSAHSGDGAVTFVETGRSSTSYDFIFIFHVKNCLPFF